MPVNATIPLTQDFLETAASYPFLTELIQHPTDGYLYGCYHSSALFGSMVKVKADNFSDITTVDFANDGQHANPVDMVYVPSTDRFYVLFRNGDANRCVISAVTPSTLARVDFFNFTDIQVGAGSITADATNLYVVTFPTTPSYLVIIPIAAPGTFAEPTPLTGFSQAHCVRQFGGKLFAQGMTPPTTGWVMRLTTAGVVEETATFTGEEGEFPVDEIGESSGHIWVGNRDLLGEIRKYSKTSFINPEVILTTQLSKCTCVKTVGGFVWAAFENGRGVRINPDNVADRRIYTLNAGEGYHSEFTGGSEFVYTYNYFEGKIARYHIPPDVVSGQISWARPLKVRDNGNSAIVNSVKTDSSGNVYATGHFKGFIDLGDGVYRESDSTLTSDLFIVRYLANGTFSWGKAFGNVLDDMGYGVTVDPSGNIIVVGQFTGTLDFGGASVTSNGAADIFVVKYSPDGTLMAGWPKNFGTPSNDWATSVTTDPSGNIIIAGQMALYPWTIQPGVELPAPNLSQGSFILKLNSAGDYQWARRFGAVRGLFVNTVACDASGNVVIGGYFTGTANLGNGDVPESGNTENGDMFIAKYAAANGAHLWSNPMGDDGLDTVGSVAIDQNNGNILITGSLQGTVDFGNGKTAIGGPTSTLYLAYFNQSGVCQWVRPYVGGERNNLGLGVAISATGQLSATGKLAEPVNFSSNPNDLLNNINASSSIFVVKFDSAAAHLWSKAYPAISIGKSVTLDAGGNVIIGGDYGGSLNFGNGVILTSPSGTTSAFIAKYS